MSIIKRHKSTIYGLTDDLSGLVGDIAAEAQARADADGDLSLLDTTNKTSLVNAINEALQTANDGGDAALLKASNLSDLTDVAAARTTLEVYSSVEVDDAITTAQLAMGSNYNTATIVERDALTDLDTADRVFVADDGDGKWAMYKPTTFVDGLATEWVKLSDQDSLENSINAASIKDAYERNDDTNAFTDVDKVKVDHLTVTAPIDLDDAVLKAGLETDLEASAPVDNAPSAAAVKSYASKVAAAGGPIPVLETLTVVGSTITLTHAPRGGVAGVMNFATVRYMDVNGVAYDAPLSAGVADNEFTIATDTVDQWDGFTVQIQYLYLDDSVEMAVP